MFSITVDFVISNVWHKHMLYFESHTHKHRHIHTRAHTHTHTHARTHANPKTMKMKKIKVDKAILGRVGESNLHFIKFRMKNTPQISL